MKNFALTITAVCLLIAAGAAGGVPVDNDLFPAGGGRYTTDDTTNFALYACEIISMELGSSPGAISLSPPAPGESFAVDSFFDITVEMFFAGHYEVDSFFDVQIALWISNGAGGGGGGGGATTYQIELISMVLTGTFDDGTSFTLQESPSLASTGVHITEPQPDGQWQVDSFFDIYFELTVGGGPVAAASGPQRMTLVPEPATLFVMGCGAIGLLRRRRGA